MTRALVLGHERTEDERRERLPAKPIDKRPAQHGLSGADVTGKDYESFAAIETAKKLLQGSSCEGVP